MSGPVPHDLTDRDLLYAATARCDCGAGLAHPLDTEAAMRLRAWVCSSVLKGEADSARDHAHLPFALWKVREETSINNKAGHSTRPAGTVARTVGRAKCPQCGHEWRSEPYEACGRGHHWYPGACPACGYAVGGSGTYASDDGPRIDTRYSTVVLGEGEPRSLADELNDLVEHLEAYDPQGDVKAWLRALLDYHLPQARAALREAGVE